MQIKPKDWIVVVEINQEAGFWGVDMVVNEVDEDKSLVTCSVIQWSETTPAGSLVIVGRYSLYKLTFNGTSYYLLEESDVLGQIENV